MRAKYDVRDDVVKEGLWMRGWLRQIALLSQEGSVIAFFAMTRGVVPKRNVSESILKECGSGTTPRTISTAVSIVLPS
jgi:hypothetical protein